MTAIGGIADSLPLLQQRGQQSEVIVIDATNNAVVGNQLAAAEGITVIPAGSTPAEGFAAGLSAARGDLVWLGLDNFIVDEKSLDSLILTLLANDELAVVSPTDFMPAYLLGRKGAIDPVQVTAVAESTAQKVLDSLRASLQVRKKRVITWNIGLSQARVEMEHPASLSVGRYSYAGTGTVIKSWLASAPIRIGDFCSISGDAKILHPGPSNYRFYRSDGEAVEFFGRGAHRPETATSFPISMLLDDEQFDEIPNDGSVFCAPLAIGNDVWVGFGAMILGPVNIGDGAIISAGAVVMKDVPPYAVVAGNPAKVVRMRFSPDAVERLQRLKWWEWSDDKILDNWRWFASPIADFLNHFDPEGAATT